jgi:hypothetical protein
MSNVVNLAAVRSAKETPVVEIPVISADQDIVSKSQDFISTLYDWAVANNVDIEDIYFKYDAAAVMTIVQGILQKASA